MKGKWKKLIAGLVCGAVICTSTGWEQVIYAKAVENVHILEDVQDIHESEVENVDLNETEDENGTEDNSIQEIEDDIVLSAGEEENVKQDTKLVAEEKIGDLTYTLTYKVKDNGTAIITGYEGTASGDLVIPEKIDGYVVTEIEDSAFIYCAGFTGNLVMPESLEQIGRWAFLDCKGLTGNLVIPESVNVIRENAFLRCSGFTGDLIIPDNIRTIGAGAFGHCTGFNGKLMLPSGITEIKTVTFEDCSGFTGDLIIPDSVSIIEGHAFKNCSGFTGRLVIPDTVTKLGEGAFYNCSHLTGGLVLSNNITEIGEAAFHNCGFDDKLILSDSITSIERYTFCNCGFTGGLIIPDSITMIDYDAFSGCSGFTGDLVIPSEVTKIGSTAFSGCEGFDGKLIISDNITSIEKGVFGGCSGFSGELVIPSNVTSIGESAFSGCSGFNGELVIPSSVTSIGNCAFSGCSGFDGELVIPNSITEIGYEAFLSCTGFNGKLVLSNKVNTIKHGTFANCNFTGQLIFPDNITAIEQGAFRGCNGFTGDLIISDNIISIGDYAFFNCSGFTGDLIIGNSVIKVGDEAFKDCSGFAGSLIIGNSVTEIGFDAFGGCSGFTGNLTIGDSILEINSSMFSDCENFTGNLTIGSNVTKIRGGTFLNSHFTGRLKLPNSIITIGANAFKGCDGFTGDLIIPNSVTEIGSNAFSGCSGFTGDLIISGSVNTIGESAFSDCSGFRGELSLKNGIVTIEEYAFKNCSKFIGDLKIPDSVTDIKGSAFSNCSGFTGELTLPNSLISIGDLAFSDCKGFMGDLIIPDNVVTIGNSTFSGCSGFDKKLSISNSVTKIGNSAFNGCDGFSGNLVIPGSVKSIGSTAFRDCKGFSGITFSNDAPEINSNAFSGMTVPVYYPEGLESWENVSGNNFGGTLTWISYKEGTEPWIPEKIITGTLEAVDALGFTITINGEKYEVTDDFDMRTPMEIFTDSSLQNKNVICVLKHGKISQMDTMYTALYPQILFRPSGGMVYQDGKFVESQKELLVTINYGVKSPYKVSEVKKLGDTSGLKIQCNKIKLSILEDGLNFGKEGLVIKKSITEIEQNVDISVGFGTNESCSFTVYSEDDFVPEDVSIELPILAEVTIADSVYQRYSSICVFNSDLQSQRAAEKKAQKEMSQKIQDTKKSLDNLNIAVDYSILDYYFDKTQKKEIQNYLKIWVAEIVSSTSITYTKQEKKIQDYVFKKLGINIKAIPFAKNTRAVTEISGVTTNYGKRNIEFTLNMQSYILGTGNPFASEGEISYRVTNISGIPSSTPTSGTMGMMTFADIEEFAKKLQDVAESSVKEAYNEVWGKYANEVANIIVDKTILNFIDQRYGSFSNGVYTLFTEPAKSYQKRISSKCPVDVYVYDMEGNMCGSIIDNVVDTSYTDICMYVIEDEKYVYLCGDDYRVKFVGNGEGTMTYQIEEFMEDMSLLRTVEFQEIPLSKGKTYEGFVMEPVLIDNSLYSLTSDKNRKIIPDIDTYQDGLIPRVFVEGIEITENTLEIREGETYTLNATVTPSYATNQRMSWSSSDEDVILVDEKGEIVAKKIGSATITVVSEDGGFEASCRVTVVPPKVEVEINGISISSKVYDGAPVSTSGKVSVISKIDKTDFTGEVELEISYNGILSDGSVYGPSEEAPVNAGNYVLTVSVPKDNDFLIGGREYSFQITKALVKISADNVVLHLNDRIPDGYTYQVNGLLNGDELLIIPLFECNIVDTKYTGNYDIIPYGADAGMNYEILYDKGILTVTEEVTCTVSFDMQGHGTVLDEYLSSIYTRAIPGGKIKEPAMPEEEGYQFIGWYKDKNCTIRWDFDTDVVTENIVLYAGWEKKNLENEDYQGVLPGDVPTDGKIPEGIWIAGIEEYTYTGAAIMPQVRVYHHDKRLIKDRDYTVSYKNNKKAALSTGKKAPMVIVKGKGNYVGTVSKKFTIEKAMLTDDCLVAASDYFAGIAYAPAVMLDGNILKARTDYTLTYYQDGREKKLKKQPKTEGNYLMQIDGKGSCEGKIIFPYEIVKDGRISISKGKAVVPGIVYGDNEPVTDLKVAGETLKNGTDYTVRFINTGAKGTATAIFTGTGKYTGILKKTFKVKAAALPENCISVDSPVAYEKGGAKPEVTVMANGTKLREGIDYTVSYTGNTRLGDAAKVTVKGKGNYGGSQSGSFKVTEKDLTAEGVHVYVSDAVTGKNPAVMIYDTNGKKLSSGSDYEAQIDTASHQVTITGGKNDLYTASTPIIREYQELEKDKVITSVSLNKKAAGFPAKFQYNVTGVQLDKSWLTVKAGKNVLPVEKFEVIGYINNDFKGTATVLVQGKGEYGGTKALNFKIQSQSILSIVQ